MRQEFNEIEAGSRILLNLSSGNKSMEMGATIARHLKDNIALITLDNSSGQVLKFDNVTINIIYTNAEGIPYIWMNSTIVYYQGQYLLQVKPEGGRRHNRRNSFRVGVSHYAKLRITGHGEVEVVVRDVSLTGFSITDRKKELGLSQGTHALLRYEDIGHELELEGNVVRIEETEEYIIYGFVITKSCRDLSSYVNLKQRQKRT
ncbi:MAG: PilZ domain-containing protein [Agathobacter sp.]|nr:PilZ domain-containing protein [Agathobacter sp.]